MFGSELLFLGVVVGLVFFGAVLPRFLLYFLAVAPEIVWKNSLDVMSVFWNLFSLLWVFFVDVVFVFFLFLFKRQSSGGNRTPHTRLFGFFFFVFLSRRGWFFSFFLSRCGWLIARFGRASRFLAFSSGCLSGPRAFLGILLELTGLELTRPFRGPFSWDARRQGCFCASLVLVVFFPFCFAAMPFLDARVGDLTEVG